MIGPDISEIRLVDVGMEGSERHGGAVAPEVDLGLLFAPEASYTAPDTTTAAGQAMADAIDSGAIKMPSPWRPLMYYVQAFIPAALAYAGVYMLRKPIKRQIRKVI